jgi:hypothetical protein
MKKLFFVLALGTALSFGHGNSLIDSDSGIQGPKYTEILKKIAAWKATYSEYSTIVDYGTTVQGRPMQLLLVMKPGSFLTRPTLLMSGSTHGNEYLNIEDRLPEELLRKTASPSAVRSFLEKGGAFIFIPILNPDGYDARIRENSHGVDLNRDWDVPPAGYKGFKEVETSALATKLQALSETHHLQYKVTVDYHCCASALLYPWSYIDKPLPEEPLLKHKSIGKMAKNYLEIAVGTTPEILQYFPVGTTKDYYYDKYQALAFTYEGAYGNEQKLLPQHVAWWEAMVAGVAEGLLDVPPLFREEIFLRNL